MKVRVLTIVLALGAAWALWFCYGQLKMFRGTPFWDYRYIIYAVLAFLGLSGLEWIIGYLKSKIEGDQGDH